MLLSRVRLRVHPADLGDRKRRQALSLQNIKTLAALSSPFDDWLPADLDDLVQFRTRHQEFACCSGPLYIFAVMGKEVRRPFACITRM
jgi:hypothetical protein